MSVPRESDWTKQRNPSVPPTYLARVSPRVLQDTEPDSASRLTSAVPDPLRGFGQVFQLISRLKAGMSLHQLLPPPQLLSQAEQGVTAQNNNMRSLPAFGDSSHSVCCWCAGFPTLE